MAKSKLLPFSSSGCLLSLSFALKRVKVIDNHSFLLSGQKRVLKWAGFSFKSLYFCYLKALQPAAVQFV